MIDMPNADELRAAAALVHAQMAPTPQYDWPMLSQAIGATCVVKHENHTPTGAFKVRGGITFMDWLMREHPDVPGVITATRGNHGQSQARAATAAGKRAVIYVPHGNSVEKNAAMAAFGGDVIVHGQDFVEAVQEVGRVAQAQGLFAVPPFHRSIMLGVASYAMELFTARPNLKTVYVPIGCGSGICGLIAARDALGLDCEIVGVVAEGAPAAKLAFEAGHPLDTPAAQTFADGMAVRMVVPDAFAIYGKGAARIIAVSDDEIAQAIRLLWRTTHNAAEGAGAASIAGAMKERARIAGTEVAAILCGGNIDTDMFAAVLSGKTPAP